MFRSLGSISHKEVLMVHEKYTINVYNDHKLANFHPKYAVAVHKVIMYATAEKVTGIIIKCSV